MLNYLTNADGKKVVMLLLAPVAMIASLVGYQLGRRSNHHLLVATANQQQISHLPGDVTDGILGKKVGTVVTIEGRRTNFVEAGESGKDFVVEKVDGKSVYRSIILSRQKLPNGTRFHFTEDEDHKYCLRGYESIAKIETGNQQKPYRFLREFIITQNLASSPNDRQQ